MMVDRKMLIDWMMTDRKMLIVDWTMTDWKMLIDWMMVDRKMLIVYWTMTDWKMLIDWTMTDWKMLTDWKMTVKWLVVLETHGSLTLLFINRISKTSFAATLSIKLDNFSTNILGKNIGGLPIITHLFNSMIPSTQV